MFVFVFLGSVWAFFVARFLWSTRRQLRFLRRSTKGCGRVIENQRDSGIGLTQIVLEYKDESGTSCQGIIENLTFIRTRGLPIGKEYPILYVPNDEFVIIDTWAGKWGNTIQLSAGYIGLAVVVILFAFWFETVVVNH